MGRVYRRHKQWWIDYYDTTGLRHREPAGATKTLAHDALVKRLDEIIRGRFSLPKTSKAITVQEMIDRYREKHMKGKRGNGAPVVLRRLEREFGHLPLTQLTVEEIQGFMNTITTASSVSNANRYHDVFRSLLYKAIDWGYHPGPNPLKKVPRGKPKKHRLRFLSPEEMRALIPRCSSRILPIVTCALYAGMRRGELLDLDWSNVRLDRGIIYILESKSDEARELPIPPTLRKLFLSLGPKESGNVFNLPPITLRRHFLRALKKADIQGFRFHDLRHTYASYHVMKNHDLPTLQKLLGHKSPMMTQRYAHLADAHLRESVNNLDDSLGHNLGTNHPGVPLLASEKDSNINDKPS
ncbi:MAG: tyrosine-type recombinase/integrase [Elusimicrobiota bacterium]